MSKLKLNHILLVEDNEGDILLTTDALEERNLAEKVTVIRDGELAINYLENIAIKDPHSLPDIILLDINLPKKNGYQVLLHIKESSLLKQILVIMLTTSSSEKDIAESYKNNANYFITKPTDVDDFNAALDKIETCWMHTLKLPNNYRND